MTHSAPKRALLGLLALTMVCAPFYGAWRYEDFRRAVTAQEAPPGPASGAAAAGADAESRRKGVAPVVLAYHDIGRVGGSRYTVTPEAFDAQLGALAAAGYRTLSSAEFVAYLRGGKAPGPRSVFLTFDDGTHGLWTHADRILATYGMRASAFLITRAVGSHRPYYLSWEEIDRMSRSGRWDFENHTHDLHRRSAVDAAGHTSSALTSRLWLPGARRKETEAEYRRRVENDLDRSIGDITRHGLPVPRLFAYPFSEASGHGPVPSVNRTLRSALDARFVAALTNSSDRPLPAGRRAAAARQVQRLEVTAATGVEDLLAGVERWTAVSPDACPAPLARPQLWQRDDHSGDSGVGALTGVGPYPRGGKYAAAAYRPRSTADWSAYTVEAAVDRLRESVNNVGLVVRDGSLDPLVVAVSFSYVRLMDRRDGRWHEIGRRKLTEAAAHRVEVTVDGDATVVVVDGMAKIKRVGTRVTGGDATGGFALSVRNGDPAGAWPRFTSLAVRPR
ncbi:MULTISPECIES: polysaccharide deacetylase family protein [unclassified Streptomyces]|uniref:polysaccharide deacetylase family protein n=1 Tax=unclassified Streptomyces TaxID=2593676 RepID=UPI0035DC04B6